MVGFKQKIINLLRSSGSKAIEKLSFGFYNSSMHNDSKNITNYVIFIYKRRLF